MGGKSTTTQQSVSIPPEVMARYNAVNARAEDVASRPFIAYSQDPNAFVAALTPSQMAGIENVNAAAGMSQPSYAAGQNMILGGLNAGAPLLQSALGQGSSLLQAGLSQGAPLVQAGYGQGQALTGSALNIGSQYGNAATNAIGAGMGPVNAEQFSGAQIDKYMSPYLSKVVEAQQALQQQEAAQQRSALTGQAIMSGAFGGDRGGIAQANLARQQSLANQATLANLLQGGYNQALGAFQQQQGVNLQAGQANRAAMQNAANQLSALGQQQYAQQLGAGQNLYQMGLGAGQSLFNMNNQTGQGLFNMGNQTGQALFNMGNQAGQAYAGLGGQAEQQALNAAQAQMAAGQIQQQTDQAAKTAMYNQFLQQQGYPYQQAQFLANVAMGTGALSGSTTTTTQPSGWSDRRLKENICKVGETYDGQPIYAYNFKGEEHAELGLIAQEVEKHNPEAVGMSKGYKTLDYKKATDDAAERGHFADGGLVPSSMGGTVYPDLNGRQHFEGGGAADPTQQVAEFYTKNLGRTGTPEEYAYWANQIQSGIYTPDQVSNAIAQSTEGKAYAAKAPVEMPTGIESTPTQTALKYDESKFTKPATLTKNAFGFTAAPAGSSFSSFSPYANQFSYQPNNQATNKGINSNAYMPTPSSSGKGSAPMGMPSTPPPEVSSRYGSANTFVNQSSMTPQVSGGKGIGYSPAPAQNAYYPQASGKGASASPQPYYGNSPMQAAAVGPAPSRPTSSTAASLASGYNYASGGRAEYNGGGIAALLQLAAQHASQYAQMPGAGVERIKHSVQMPSREAIAALRSTGAAPRPSTLSSSVGEAAQMGKNIDALIGSGEKLSKNIFGGTDDKGTRIPSMSERFRAAGSPQQGPTQDGTTVDTVKPGASLDADNSIKLAGGKVDPDDWLSKNAPDSSFPVASGKGPTMDMATGGRIGYFTGGRTGYSAGGLPKGLTLGEGIDIPDEKSDLKIGGSGGGGGGGKGGGGIGDAIGAVGTAVSIGSTLAKAIPAILAMIPSDERVKHDKEPIGELFDGQKVYRYHMGDGRTQIGLMAQEVEKRYPHAVGEVDGVKMVDYRKATSKARPHKYGGGELEGEISPEEKALELARQAKEDRPVQMAARGDTATDAPMPGLEAVKTSPTPADTKIPLIGAGADSNIFSDDVKGPETAGLGATAAPNFSRALDRVFKEEGYLNKKDTNGEPSLYGINRKYHPDFFNNPSKENAAKIYKQQYWDAIDADNMSPELAHVAFDTAVISGVNKAKELVAASGGDPTKLLALRQDFQNGLIQSKPDKYGDYATAWTKRINNLKQDIANIAQGTEPGQTVQTNDVGEGTRQQARTPGLAGPGLGPMDKKSAPFLNLLERAGGNSIPDELKSSAFWRPVLAGVGTMLASNKPHFGQALGEGLVGAVAASGGEEERAQLLGASRANVEKTMSDIVGSSFKTENGVTFIRIIKPDGSYDWFPYNEWLAADPDKRPKVDPRIEAVVNAFGRATPNANKKPDGGTTGEAGTNAPAKDTTAPKTAVADAGEPAVSLNQPKVRPAIPGTDVPRTEAGTPTVVALSKKQAQAAAQAAFEMAGSDAATKKRAEEVDYFDPQQKMATGARAQQQVLVPLAGSFAALPAKGSISTSGKAQEYLQPITATLNNFAAIAGKPDLVQDPNILMNQNEVNKLVNQLQQGRLNDAQLRAVSAFRELAEGIPSLSTSPGGQYALMAKLLSANMREIDKDTFFNDWQQAGRGNRGQFRDYVRLTSREANRAFDNEYTDAFYAAERKALERMFKDKSPDAKTGKEIPTIEWMAKYGSTLTAQDKKAVRDAYGPGILRYFGISN